MNDTRERIWERVRKACEARGAELRSRQIEALIDVLAELVGDNGLWLGDRDGDAESR